MSKEKKEKNKTNAHIGKRIMAAFLAVLMVFSMCITPVAYLISILSNK